MYFKRGPFWPHLPSWLRWAPGWFQGRGWPHTDARAGTPAPLLTSGEGRGLESGLSHVASEVLRPQGAACRASRWAGTSGAGRDAPTPRDRAGRLSPTLTPRPRFHWARGRVVSFIKIGIVRTARVCNMQQCLEYAVAKRLHSQNHKHLPQENLGIFILNPSMFGC